MRKLRLSIVLVGLAAATALAQPANPTASDAWIVEPAAGATTAVAYLTLSNPGMYDIYVMSATTPAADKVELREGAGAAEKVVSNITVSSYGSAELKAGEGHLVLTGLKRPLKAGDTVELTLMTDGGVKMVASAVVKKAP
jgi:copper(I)-binding protein